MVTDCRLSFEEITEPITAQIRGGAMAVRKRVRSKSGGGSKRKPTRKKPTRKKPARKKTGRKKTTRKKTTRKKTTRKKTGRKKPARKATRKQSVRKVPRKKSARRTARGTLRQGSAASRATRALVTSAGEVAPVDPIRAALARRRHALLSR